MKYFCRLCSHTLDLQFSQLVLKKYDVKYLRCTNCGLLQTEQPFWLQEAYSNPINCLDTGILIRNKMFSRMLSTFLYFTFPKHSKFVDYAGGYGIFTRLMRDYGFDFYWHDPFANNFVARFFEFSDNLGKIDLLTSFESFEHFENPVSEIQNMLDIADTIIFSTVLTGPNTPDPQKWWYYFFEHGQHISFYSKQTLQYLANFFSMNFCTDNRSYHMLTKRNLSQFRFISLSFAGYLGLDIVPQLLLKGKNISDMNYIRTII